ncbi:MAG: hypothetical protein DME67_01595 [Verrucomicrobia bacterium]|nr:MAG: hypothetical protein DME67_01595 [Verrucomicrobiota bacterium]
MCKWVTKLFSWGAMAARKLDISAVELAEKAGTITWEIITRIGARVRRVYV